MSSSSDGAGSLSFLRIVDLIPESDSREVDQNSEPSIAVNPVDPRQLFAGAFIFDGPNSPFFVSTDAGATWSIYGAIAHHDKSIAWKADGSGVLVAVDFNDDLDTYSATVPGSGFAAPINHYIGSHDNDQPWIRTGPSNHVYLGFNDDGASAGKEASVNVSTDGGSSYRTVTLDRLGGTNGGQPRGAHRGQRQQGLCDFQPLWDGRRIRCQRGALEFRDRGRPIRQWRSGRLQGPRDERERERGHNRHSHQHIHRR